MSSDASTERPDAVVQASGLGKCYHVYERPQDRLRQFFAGKNKRYYREFWALRDLDLTVYRGETLGIVGRNGAGKSTLLQMIAGTLKPTTGDVTTNGRVTALLELGSGFHHDFTGRENVFVAGALLGLDRDAMNERMERIESFADIGEFIDRPVKTYSKGMFARLSFSVYANLDPEVFIVDEALAVGDARFRHKCMYRFKQMQEQGVAVIYVSHDATSMKHLCDRVAWIDKGRLEQVGDPTPVVDEYLNHLFHGQRPTPIQKGKARSGVRGDDELGSGEATFIACHLRDQDGNDTEHVPGGTRCELELTLRNDSMPDDADPLLVGFSIASVHGLAITGANTTNNDVQLERPPRGDAAKVRFRFTMPPLVPGSYSISLTAATIDAAGETKVLHQVQNALTFQSSSERKVFGLIGLPVDVEVRDSGPRDQSSR